MRIKKVLIALLASLSMFSCHVEDQDIPNVVKKAKLDTLTALAKANHDFLNQGVTLNKEVNMNWKKAESDIANEKDHFRDRLVGSNDGQIEKIENDLEKSKTDHNIAMLRLIDFALNSGCVIEYEKITESISDVTIFCDDETYYLGHVDVS